MKTFFTLTILSLSTNLLAADWKVIAETTSCDEKIQVLGKEGEKYVLAIQGDKKTKLVAEDGSTFVENSMKNTVFSSKGETSYTFTQPSYVEANPAKIDVSHTGVNKRCSMESKN